MHALLIKDQAPSVVPNLASSLPACQPTARSPESPSRPGV